MLATVLIPSSMVASPDAAAVFGVCKRTTLHPGGRCAHLAAKSKEPLDAHGWFDAHARSARTQAERCGVPEIQAGGAGRAVPGAGRPQAGGPLQCPAHRGEARLVLARGADRSSACPVADALFLGVDKARQRAFRPGGHGAPHPARAGRHREAAPDRRPALARHAGHHVAGGALAVRPGPRARPVARERPLLRPLRRHHAGQGRRLAAQVLGLRPGVVSAHRSGRDHADHRRRPLPAGPRAPLRRQDVSRRWPASSSRARTSSTPCAAR